MTDKSRREKIIDMVEGWPDWKRSVTLTKYSDMGQQGRDLAKMQRCAMRNHNKTIKVQCRARGCPTCGS